MLNGAKKLTTYRFYFCCEIRPMVWVQVMHDFNPLLPFVEAVPKNLTGYSRLCSDNRRQTKRIAIAFRRAWNVI
jgi:hypothetical protein